MCVRLSLCVVDEVSSTEMIGILEITVCDLEIFLLLHVKDFFFGVFCD